MIVVVHDKALPGDGGPSVGLTYLHGDVCKVSVPLPEELQLTTLGLACGRERQ
jgi:hypothetical protein